MKKYLILTILVVMILAIIISGCNNSANQTMEVANSEVNNVEIVTNNEEPINNSTSVESTDNQGSMPVANDKNNTTESTDLEEMFPLYVQYLGTIADSINTTLSDLETKDQYYFEQNPSEGIGLLYNIITDYKGYISVLEDLEYNSNPDISHLNSLFIDGLEENIRVFELSIDSLEKGAYNEEEYANQLTVVQEKFDKFSKEYSIIAKKANYINE